MSSPAPVTYKPFGRPARNLTGTNRLYVSDTHLLNVNTVWVRDEYKRFFYEDIQAITAVENSNAAVTNVVLILAALACTALALLIGFAGAHWAFIAFLALIAALFAGATIHSIMKGPSCTCRIYTAVSRDELPSIQRLRTAEQLVKEVRPRIEAAQAELMQESTSVPVVDQPMPAFVQQAASAPIPKTLRYTRARVHEFFFAYVIVDFIKSLISMVIQHEIVPNSVELFVLGVGVILAVWALVGQQNTNLPTHVRRIPWLYLLWVVIGVVAGLAYTVFYMIQGRSVEDLAKNRYSDPFFFIMQIVELFVITIPAGFAWRALRQYRAAAKTPPVFAAAPPAVQQVDPLIAPPVAPVTEHHE